MKRGKECLLFEERTVILGKLRVLCAFVNSDVHTKKI